MNKWQDITDMEVTKGTVYRIIHQLSYSKPNRRHEQNLWVFYLNSAGYLFNGFIAFYASPLAQRVLSTCC
jgi:hypothetical protein